MIRKYKLNKSELTALKQEVKVYMQFLPVLKLKQEQLQIEQIRIKKQYSSLKEVYDKAKFKISKNAEVLCDPKNPYEVQNFLKPKKVSIIYKSLAGVKIPVIEHIIFDKFMVNFFDAPYWLAFLIKDLQSLVMTNIKITIVRKQYALIQKELKKATQKVNLFEKVLIPETKQAIKKINIILGDEQVAAVGRAKIAKNKNIVVL
jgi:V/A-type H+-transporting ATPase subunit D